MGALVVLFICIGTIAVVALRHKIGVPSRYSIPPFQAGVLYRNGRPLREVGPGRHLVFRGREKIMLVDTRPIQISIENRAVALADGATVVYGFTASAQVVEAKKAIYSSANYSKIPAFITLCVARSALNRCQSNQIRIGQVDLTDQIMTKCRTRLTAAGFELLSFRFNQLVIANAGPPSKPNADGQPEATSHPLN
jgi:regulator of protease activity HflC (stomatin/prohibitin superfamily)